MNKVALALGIAMLLVSAGSLFGQAAHITATSGGGQWATEGGSYTNHLTVAVTDPSNYPISGVTVDFSGPGIVSTSSPTDAFGLVSVPVTANSTPGGNTVTASINGSPQIMTTFGLMVGAAGSCSQTNVVTSTADSNAVGTLREAVFDLCPGGTVDLSQLPNNSIITLSNRIYLSQDITLKGPTNGNTVTISGNNATRLFFLESGNVTITNLTLANGLGQGGNSGHGGGAAGTGGAIFQFAGTLNISNVVFASNTALGGSSTTSYKGGGGAGFGGDATNNPGAGGGDLGGTGGSGGSLGAGGNGGAGAGGGSSGEANGGGGGFGGGGGGGGDGSGGTGGFGAGGGQGLNAGGPGGFAGGNGNSANAGGGGAGLGGAIFAYSGNLSLTSVQFLNNTATAGAGANNGQAKGGALFVYNGVTAHLIDVTFTGSVAADANKPGIGASTAPYTNGATCPGFDTVDICGDAYTITSPDAVQTAYTGSAFNTLQINVAFDGAAPPNGTMVTFTAPSTGASGTFSNAYSNLNGTVAQADFTANGITGTYQVTATVPGYGTQTFTLTNQCGSVPVTNTNDSGHGSLRAAVLAACPGGTIDLTSLAAQTITLQSRLYISQDLTIQGPANGTVTIDGGNATRLFFIQSGNVTMTNLTLAHGLGQGGNGGYGGGAAGMGGAIFQNGGNLTLTNVGFIGNQALGGSTVTTFYGGGGFGGSGGQSGNGGSGGDLGGAGGVNGGNGGAGGGGGSSSTGGAGGFGGGGGGGGNVGGPGGFGGGGGDGQNGDEIGSGVYGGAGGFGAGMGAGFNQPGAVPGGGGAGFGGAIFEFSGTLTLNSVIFSANTTTGGTGYQNGQAKGAALFVYYGATANLNNVTFSGDTAADAAQASIGSSTAPYTNGATCPGFDTTDICGLVSFGFGSVNVGQTVSQTIAFNLNATGTSIVPAVLTAGAPNLDYKLVSTTCPSTVASLPLVCTVTVSFTPQYAGERPGAVYLANSSGAIASTALLNGIGVGPQIAFGPGVQSTLSSAFLRPSAVAVDGAGDVFVADQTRGIIYELPAGGGSPIPVISINGPRGVALDGAGNLFYTSPGHVYELKKPYTGTPIALGSGINGPAGVAVDAAGNVFVTDLGLQNVIEIPASGSPQTTLASGFSVPADVAVDVAGNVYVADEGYHQVYKLPADGSAQTTVGSGFVYPFGLALNAAGDLYVGDAGHVYRVPADGSTKITIVSGLVTPIAVAVNAAGDVFIADGTNNAAYQVQFSQPPTLTFPNTNVSSTSTAQSITIENIGNASLVESALTVGTNFTQVAGSGTPADCTATTTLLQGASCNLSLAFAPTSGGPLTGSAQLTNNSLNQSPATQSISLSGSGVTLPSTLAVTVTPIGTFTQGQTAEWDVNVYNLAASANNATSGTTTLVDTLPTGYTLSSSVGTGWNCLAVTTTITCTSTQIVAGASGAFAKLQLIVNVPGASALNATDNVSVYGGGDPNHSSLGNAAKSFSTVPVTQTAASITITGGNSQTTAVNTAFLNNLNVTVKDSGGNPISGSNVVFTAPSTGPSGVFGNNTNASTVVTSASGTASIPFTANTTAGPYNVTAAVGQLSTAFSLTNSAGAAASITANAGTTPQSATINTAFANPLAVTVKDTYGNPVSGANVVFTAPSTGPSGVFSNTTGTITGQTNGSGTMSAPFTANATAGGPYSVTATTGQLSTTFYFTNTAGAAASITANPGTTPQSTNVNTAFPNPLAVTVKDSGGNPVSGVSVTFFAPIGGAFSNNSVNLIVPTNSSGVASASFTANSQGQGPYIVTASINSGQLGAPFSLTNNFLTQTIQNFGTIPTQTVGTSLVLTATATSGLAVIYQSNTPTVCSVSGSTANFFNPGLCSVTASQLGNGTYSAAPTITQQFTVNPNTPTISNLQAVTVAGNSEVISWTTDQPSTTQVNYGASSSYGSSSALDINLVTFHSVTLANLSANTTYNFDVSSTNSTSGTVTSINSTFTTTPYVGYVAFWGVNNSGVTISWSTDIAASTSVAYGTTTALGQLSTVQNGLSNSHGLVLTGLNPGTTYYFRALSTTASGSTGGSTIYSFTTTGVPASPAPVITNVAVSGITTTSVTITWTTDQAASSQVNYGATTAYGSSSLLNSSLQTSHSVTLTGLSPGTTYDYDVVSTNTSGTSSGMSTNYTFTTTAVVSAPPVISNIQAAVTSNSATITWTTDQPSWSLVNYGATTVYGSSSTLNTNLVKSHSVTLTGLSAGSTYNFDVVSENAAALITTSPNGTFTTTASNATPPYVGYVAFWGVNNSGATISWSTDVPASGQLAYGTTPALGQTTPLQAALINSHGVVLTGLNSGTTYYFVAQSTAANGATGYSTTYSFTTSGAPSAPSPIISNVLAGSITTTSATITWTTDQAASSQVNYGVTTTYTSSSTLDPTLNTLHSVTLTNLSPGTTYDFAVMSASSSSSSATSTNYTFATTGSAPGPVITSVAASSITSGTALITWTTDQAASSQVNYGSANTSVPGLVTAHSVLLTGLTPNTTYSFNVTSANAANASTTSGNFSFTTSTASAAPPVISYVAYWGITGSGVIISWSTNVPSNTSLAFGTTNALGQVTPVQTALSNSHGITLTNLLPSTPYYFQAQSADVNGNTGYSTIYSFTTAAGVPVVSNVIATPAAGNTATLSWTTSVPTYSYVQYGPSAGNYNRYSAQTGLTATPIIKLPYVPSGTVHYQLVSTDANGNQVVTPDATFVEP